MFFVGWPIDFLFLSIWNAFFDIIAPIHLIRPLQAWRLLGAKKHLCKGVCPSVRPSLRRSVTPSHFRRYPSASKHRVARIDSFLYIAGYVRELCKMYSILINNICTNSPASFTPPLVQSLAHALVWLLAHTLAQSLASISADERFYDESPQTNRNEAKTSLEVVFLFLTAKYGHLWACKGNEAVKVKEMGAMEWYCAKSTHYSCTHLHD